MKYVTGFFTASILAIGMYVFGDRVLGWVFARNDEWQARLDREARR